MADVIIQVLEFSDGDTVYEIRLHSPLELSGLYSGISIGENSTSTTLGGVDVIQLYRRPLLDELCETGEDHTRPVRHVLRYKIGHHFGLSDVDMARIETVN